MSKAQKAAQLDMLDKGKFVMLRRRDEDDQQPYYSLSQMFDGRPQGHKAVAVGPYRIAATNLPFVCIEVNGRREVIDGNDYEFYIVDRSFARAMGLGVAGAEHGRDDGPAFTTTRMFQPKKKRRRTEKPGKEACKVCGYPKTKQKLVKVDGVLRCVHFCPECGRSGQPVEQ